MVSAIIQTDLTCLRTILTSQTTEEENTASTHAVKHARAWRTSCVSERRRTEQLDEGRSVAPELLRESIDNIDRLLDEINEQFYRKARDLD